jgi:hypothetical protein
VAKKEGQSKLGKIVESPCKAGQKINSPVSTSHRPTTHPILSLSHRFLPRTPPPKTKRCWRTQRGAGGHRVSVGSHRVSVPHLFFKESGAIASPSRTSACPRRPPHDPSPIFRSHHASIPHLLRVLGGSSAATAPPSPTFCGYPAATPPLATSSTRFLATLHFPSFSLSHICYHGRPPPPWPILSHLFSSPPRTIPGIQHHGSGATRRLTMLRGGRWRSYQCPAVMLAS